MYRRTYRKCQLNKSYYNKNCYSLIGVKLV